MLKKTQVCKKLWLKIFFLAEVDLPDAHRANIVQHLVFSHTHVVALNNKLNGRGNTSSTSAAQRAVRQQVARLRVEAAAARGITVTGLVLMALGGGVTVMKKLAAA